MKVFLLFDYLLLFYVLESQSTELIIAKSNPARFDDYIAYFDICKIFIYLLKNEDFKFSQNFLHQTNLLIKFIN